MDLLELAKLCEKAEAPDRELDAAVVMALYPEAQIGEYAGYEDIVFHARPLVADKEILPFFTASLDAAMTLTLGLPKTIGAGPGLLNEAKSRLSERFALHIQFWPETEDYTSWLARYVTAAALRAKASPSSSIVKDLK